MLHIAVGEGQGPDNGYSWGETPPAVLPQTAQGAGRALQLAMINEGVQLMGDGMMVSSVHNDSDVDRTVAAFRASLRAMKDDGAVF
jgi:hypothetical protein